MPISLNDILAHHVTHDTTLTQNHLEPTQRPSSPFADIPSPPDTSKSTQPNQQPLYYSTRPIQPLARLKDYHVNHVFFLHRLTTLLPCPVLNTSFHDMFPSPFSL